MWRIGELLVRKNLITWKQLEEALEEQQETGELIGEVLVRRNLVAKPLLYLALAEQAGIRFVDLHKIRLNPAAIAAVPGDFVRRYQIMPVELQDGILTVAVPGPVHLWPEEQVLAGNSVRAIRRVLCLPGMLAEVIEENYPAA